MKVIMQLTLTNDIALNRADGTRILVNKGEKLCVFIKPVLHPSCAADMPLFDHGHSEWKFEVSVQLSMESPVSDWIGYRSPHDLWRLLRGKVGQAVSNDGRPCLSPYCADVLNDLLLCAEGDRYSYLVLLLSKEGESAVKVLDKHCGFRLSLYTNGSRLFWVCGKGLPGGMEIVAGSDRNDFSRGFFFECSLREFLSLPAYEPISGRPDEWRIICA
jgi:hypothetical protein